MRRAVPHFRSLRDFFAARNSIRRSVLYLDGPEREDLQARLWRHGVSPSILFTEHLKTKSKKNKPASS